MQTANTSQPAPQPTNMQATDFKDFVQVLVVLCNEKIKNFHINRLTESDGEVKNDLIEFMDHFDELFLNTKDLIIYNKPNMTLKVQPPAKDITIQDLCQLIEKWVCLDGYTIDEPTTTIFGDGASLFNLYLNALINAGLYKVV